MFLVNFDGVTCIIKSEPFITSSYDVLHSIPSGNTTFGKNLHLFSLFIMYLSSSENDQILTCDDRGRAHGTYGLLPQRGGRL